MSHQRVIDNGTDGLKLHPLHVVKGTLLANQWRRGQYTTLDFNDYISIAAEMIKFTPADVVFHRLTATASEAILLAPLWCRQKWAVLNAIHDRLHAEHARQGCALH